MKTTELTRIALMTALLCILAPISIPIPVSSVALSLSTFALCLSVYVLPPRQALFSVLLYLLLGAAGLPVFSGFSGGISRFASPGGGYLIGYFFLTAIGGKFLRKYSTPVLQALGFFLGMIAMYLIGTLWLASATGVSFLSALPAGMFVFLPFDLLKIALAVSIGRKIQHHIK